VNGKADPKVSGVLKIDRRPEPAEKIFVSSGKPKPSENVYLSDLIANQLQNADRGKSVKISLSGVASSNQKVRQKPQTKNIRTNTNPVNTSTNFYFSLLFFKIFCRILGGQSNGSAGARKGALGSKEEEKAHEIEASD
jgi:hypothetical protein